MPEASPRGLGGDSDLMREDVLIDEAMDGTASPPKRKVHGLAPRCSSARERTRAGRSSSTKAPSTPGLFDDSGTRSAEARGVPSYSLYALRVAARSPSKDARPDTGGRPSTSTSSCISPT